MAMQYDDRVAHTLLNDFDMRNAIHAAPFANQTHTLAGFFEMCTRRINLTTLVNSALPYHRQNINRGASPAFSIMDAAWQPFIIRELIDGFSPQ